ncbi:MAG: hypothetical protein V3Q69_14015 (plasmid) [Burkholderia sp.]
MLHKSSVRTQWNGLRTSLVCNPFISPEIIDPKFVINMPVDAIASSRSIYATTPSESGFVWGQRNLRELPSHEAQHSGFSSFLLLDARSATLLRSTGLPG